MQLLRVPYYKQKTSYTCGPAALRMVFAYFNKRVPEHSLAKKMRASTTRGTTHQAMIRTARQTGFYVYVNPHATFEELVFLLAWRYPVIINYTEPSGNIGHYAVVTGITKKRVILHDPWNGNRFILSRRSFLARWYDMLPRSISEHWLMAISRHDFQLGKQFKPTT